MQRVASGRKISFHEAKIKAYLAGEPIYPVTLELDITSQCSRICADCPSCRSPVHMNLPLAVVDRLFKAVSGKTKGLLMTGGEATLSPDFSTVMRLAREQGFEDIAIVTNGSQLAMREVADALCEYATTIRLSMYDWDADSCGGIEPTLSRIAALRNRIDQTGSKLKIGISALTDARRIPRLPELGEAVKNAGADWIYFHPMCKGWSDSQLVQVDQSGVVPAIENYRKTQQDGFEVHISPARYLDEPLDFDGYHAAHFLVVIGADGKNYLGAEVKYQPRFVIGDILKDGIPDFLWQPERLAKIRAITSRNYSALGSRHRGVLYNDYLEKVKHGQEELSANPEQAQKNFGFPHVL